MDRFKVQKDWTTTPATRLPSPRRSNTTQVALDNKTASVISSTMTGNFSTFQIGQNALQSLLSRVAHAHADDSDDDDDNESKTVDTTTNAEDDNGSRSKRRKKYPARRRKV